MVRGFVKKKIVVQEFGRMRLIFISITFGFIFIMGKTVIVASTFTPNINSEMEESKIITKETHSKTLLRPDIVDRNGELLARNIVLSDFYLIPEEMFHIEEDLAKLKAIFPEFTDKDIQKLNEKIQNRLNYNEPDKKGNAKKMVLIKQAILPPQKQRIYESSIIGVHFEDRQQRIYPYKNITSHVVGFVSIDGKGMAGIERWIENNDLKDILDNGKIRLSIDVNIQSLVREALKNAVQAHNAKEAFGAIINVKTGEIITAISLPDFNPNNLHSANSDWLFNRFSLGVYELGSVFKVFLATLAIQEGISFDQRFNSLDPYTVDGFEIKNFRFSRKMETMNLVEILKHSSNVACARVMEIITPRKQQEMFDLLGFRERLQIEIPEVGRSLMPKIWYKANTITASYGHGIATSPLQFLVAAAAIINNGNFVKPTFLATSIRRPPQQIRKIISDTTSAKVRQILREVVEGGSGRRSAAEMYDVGGKSGTAIQVVGSKYSRKDMIVSFFAGVPMSQPEYAYFIGLIGPKVTKDSDERNTTGGGIIAPIMGKVITVSAPMLGISVTNTPKQKPSKKAI